MIFDYVQAVENDREVRLPRIVESADPETAARFNADVTRRLKEYACDGVTTGRVREKKRFKAIAAVTFASDQLLSYRISFDYYCGGPYPSKYDSGVTWNLKAGVPIRFFEVFKDADDRRPLLKAALKKGGAVSCNADQILKTNDPLEFVVVSDGIELWPDFARVPQTCKMRPKMRFSELNSFLLPTTVLKGLFTAATTVPLMAAPKGPEVTAPAAKVPQHP